MREPTSGIVIATVVSNHDDEGLGRIEIRFPWQGKNAPTRMAYVSSIMAGDNSGAFFMPREGDEVLCAFDQGDFEHCFVIGFTWNPQRRPPATDDRERIFRSANGHNWRFIDSTEVAGNRGAMIMEDAHGNCIVVTNSLVRIISTGHLDLQARSMNIMGRVVNPVPNDV